MGANYVLLETITVGEAGASSVTFNNIPQTGYTDLKVVMSSRNDGSAASRNVNYSFNGLSTNQTSIALQGNGSAASSFTTTTLQAGDNPAATATANTFSNTEIYIPNYTSSNYKSSYSDATEENNGTAAISRLLANLWSSTAAITSITFSTNAGNFTQYSTFSLYGLAAVGTTPVIAPYASGGDIITNDGTYWIHTFLSSGTFTPAKALTCDYLVVAGGGGAGYANGGGGSGGGGAGGLRSTVTATGGGGSLETALSVMLNTAYTVTVGAGGASGGSTIPISGGNSSISGTGITTVTSIGGGASTINGTFNAASGGSGGGAAYQYAGGAGTTNQGYAGGNGSPTGSPFGGGGGGGAGAAGSSAGGSSGGANGGNGVATSISGSSVTYAGGGGGGSRTGGSGGSGGSGGGGNGSSGSTGTSGTANTGGGGGGGSDSTNGGKGGSGIVIVRYAI